MKLTFRSRQGLALVAGLALSLPLLLGQGCPSLGTGDTAGAPSVVVRSPSLDQTLAIGERVTLVYDVISAGATTISAFYDFDGVAGTGDEVIFSENLPKGENKFTQLLTSGLSGGTYRIGVIATNSAGTTTAYAAGRVSLAGSPSITFASPVGAVRVAAGVQVPIEFTATQTSFTWRTFYDTDGVLDNDEITILQGNTTDSASVQTSFDTSSLASGTYFVGVTISTPAGGSITSYAPGSLTIVTGSFIQLLAPTVGLVATPGTPVQITVAANDPGNTASSIRLFYDADNSFGNGNETTITTIAITGSGATWDTAEVAPGTYWVGAELLNGLNPSLVSYSAGPVQLGVGSGNGGGGGGGSDTLRLITPQSDTTILQNRTFRITWRTNVDPGEATVTVFREPDADGNGEPDGEATRVTIGSPGLEATLQAVDFNTTGVVGRFHIGATLTPVSGAEPITAYAPGTLTIRPLYFWVGDLLTKKDEQGRVIAQSGPFQGAVIQGVNFHDNLGTAMLTTDDYDGDGYPEIVLAAQYAKPFYYAQGGRGAGEAYMIYGQASRLSGSIGANAVGVTVPGLVFTGIVPNRYQGDLPLPDIPFEGSPARAGNSVPYTVDGQPAPPYASEGLRSIITIPDQDGDGKRELVFSFPWCNSYSLRFQAMDGFLQDSIVGIGRLENNGHFLRGGLVIVSSLNPLINSREAVSRRLDRVLQLHQVGQVFTNMTVPNNWPGRENHCDNYDMDPDGNDTWIFPCEGFWQDTLTFISPPRLADPLYTSGWILSSRLDLNHNCLYEISLAQVDAPPGPTDPFGYDGVWDNLADENAQCAPEPAFSGFMYVGGSGFYSTGSSCADRQFATPLPPYGYRLLGQVTTQLGTGGTQAATTANRFGHSISVSNDFLLVGAPRRTETREYVVDLPETAREESGAVYMIRLKREGAPDNYFPYAVPGVEPYANIPYPHNWIVDDLGFYVYTDTCRVRGWSQNAPDDNIGRPFHVVGASPHDQIGDVTGAYDINADGTADFVVGGAGTNGGRGSVYVIYRRQQELENDYLLERLALDPTNINRLNGLMIIGEPGENLGTAVAAGGPLNDDYNNDGFPDVLIGSPRATPAAGFMAGQTFVLFGGKNLLNPAGGITLNQLRDSGDGMLITGAYAGDMSGMTVANAGDVNGDGIPDILIAAPEASPRFDSDGDGVVDTIGLDYDANGVPDDLDGDGSPDDMTNAGLVYIVFGGQHLQGTIGLNLIGTPDLPGFVFVGRKGGDRMGGGYTQPSNPNVPDSGLLARGVNTAGDLDGDGRDDLMLGAVLADPDGKENAGEVYLIYGFTP